MTLYFPNVNYNIPHKFTRRKLLRKFFVSLFQFCKNDSYHRFILSHIIRNLYTSTKRSQIKRLYVKHRMVGSDLFNLTPPPLPPPFCEIHINQCHLKRISVPLLE